MGQCVSPSQPQNRQSYSFATEPAGTQDLRGKELPKLYFHSVLANVKIKNYPYAKAIPLFKVREGEIFTLAAKATNEQNTIAWKINQGFDFQMTQYQLRKQFLQIGIQNESHSQVAKVKINLYLITTGPYYHDFQLKFPNGKTGRISFDLKISQIIDLKIKSERIQLFFNKKHPGQEFCYSIKAINGYLGASIQSEPSYPTVVLLQKKQKENSREIDQSLNKNEAAPQNDINELVLTYDLPKRKSKRQMTIELQEGEQLKWTNKGGTMPMITTKVVASYLHNSYFQILVWKYQGQEEQSSKELFADCYVSFYKLLGTEPKTIHVGLKEYQQRSINMTEKLQHLGKFFGSCNFQFTIINQPYFRQYQLGVHTEVGILKNTPIFGIKETKTSDKSPQLNELIAISYSVQQNMIALNKLQADEGSRKEIKKLKSVVEQGLLNIYNLLQKTSNPPSFLYTYGSQKELLEGQKILVELGMKITNYSQGQDPATTDLCWLILISLMKRGQFGLNQMGFSQKQKKQIGSHTFNDVLTFKQEVGIVYKVFLYKLLDIALNSIDHKGSEYERTFAQIFSAYAYFRIPQFRKEILRLITKETDPQIVEWRGVEFSLEDNEQQTYHDKGNNVFNEMFDWERHFHKWLAKNEQVQSENISLNEILSQKSWKERFIKRGSAFFYFIKYWVTYVDSNLHSSKDIQWNYFPGYNRLLKGFFVEMKLRPILQYPDALLDAGLKLLVNYKLLNPIFKIILNKVYVFDTSSVLRVIEYINMIFQTVGEKHKQLPFSFNYSYFFKALTIIFDSDFSMSVSSALTLLYTHFQVFHIQFRKSLSMYFLGKAFNKFFLHWSYHVREVFYHLLAYRIYGDAMKYKDYLNQGGTVVKNADILARYQDQMKIMSFQAKNYNRFKQPNLHPTFEKCLFKKMRIKNYQNFKSNKQDTQSQFAKSENPIHQISIVSSANQQSEGKTKIKPTTIKKQRCYSQTLSQGVSFVNFSSEHKVNKKDEIRRHSRFNEFSYEHQYIGKQSSIFHQIIPESQFKICNIDKNSLKLIQNCLKSYTKVEKEFLDNFEKGFTKGPILKQEIALDKRQIRPKQFDDW